ncbi:MAG: dermonecrotic toxin domain-containing protein, partial [Pseudomonas helleri]
GFDGSGLLPEGRNLYRGRDGQGYLKLDGGFCKTTVQNGERFVYSPRNISNRRKVVWENGRWQAEAPNRLLGGGPVMSLFRAPETPQQKKYNALLEGYLVDHYNPPGDMVREAANVIGAMPEVLAQRVLDESIIDARVSGIEAYRSLMKLLNRQRRLPPEYKASSDTLVYKLDVWSAVHSATRDFETSVPGLKFSDVQKIKIFDMALPYRNAYYETTGMNIALMPDNATGAVFIGITPLRGKKGANWTKSTRITTTLAFH